MINKIYISYFYQIRNFDKSILPFSTAVSDPLWFHNSQGKTFIYKDKNGVYNGLRVDDLVPGKSCDGLCRGRSACQKNPSTCDFLTNYRSQLNSINFNKFIRELESVVESYKKEENIEAVIPAFIVYEAPDNPCSERWVIKEWLQDNGMICEEYVKK